MSKAKERWIGENLKKGELYAGIILGKDGAPDQHIILLPGAAESVSWAKAKAFARKAGGHLPTRREQSLLFANLKEQFQKAWYWSGEQHATHDGYAWDYDFSNGYQDSAYKQGCYRARAVRRVPLE